MRIYRKEFRDENGRYCAGGLRAWFGRHGLSYHDMCAHGIDDLELLNTGTPEAEKLVARVRAARGQE